MASIGRVNRPVAISIFDLADGQDLLLRDCEDCAFAVSSINYPIIRMMLPSKTDDTRWVCGGAVMEIALGEGYQLLFNPVGRGGVVVVNEPGYRIFRAFRSPMSAGDVLASYSGRDADAHRMIRRLGELEMIHPMGHVQRPEFVSGDVLTAWLHVTNACNLRCPYCYVSKSNDRMDEFTGRTAVTAVLRSAVEQGFTAVKLKYAGGEASLNRHLLMDLHTFARELAARSGLKLYATLLSNGVALSPGLIEMLRSEDIRVMVSLDGVGSQHDVQRPFVNGKPSFHSVERGIARLIERHHAPHLSITITERNAEGLADVVRFALERDLTFSLNLFRDNDCATAFPDLHFEQQDIIANILKAFGVIEEFLPRWSVLGLVLDRGQLLEQRQYSCGVGRDYVVIDQRGQVARCHMEIEKTLGTVFKDDPLRLVRSDKTSTLNLMVDEKEGCRDCTWRYWCSGGCPVATFRATGRYDIKSPNCNIYKAIYPQALRLEALRLLKYAASQTK